MALDFDGMGMETPGEDLEALAALVRWAQFGRRKAREDGPPSVVEVGSWAGRTALAMARAGACVFCVDHFRGSPGDVTCGLAGELGSDKLAATFFKNTRGLLFDSIFPLVGESLWWARVLPFEADLVFLDAAHDYASVAADIEAWLPKVRKGGILCGHDYWPPGSCPEGTPGYFPGVARAVDRLGKDGVVGRTVWWKRL